MHRDDLLKQHGLDQQTIKPMSEKPLYPPAPHVVVHFGGKGYALIGWRPTAESVDILIEDDDGTRFQGLADGTSEQELRRGMVDLIMTERAKLQSSGDSSE